MVRSVLTGNSAGAVCDTSTTWGALSTERETSVEGCNELLGLWFITGGKKGKGGIPWGKGGIGILGINGLNYPGGGKKGIPFGIIGILAIKNKSHPGGGKKGGIAVWLGAGANTSCRAWNAANWALIASGSAWTFCFFDAAPIPHSFSFFSICLCKSSYGIPVG